MAATIGSIDKYDGKEDWTEYIERFKQFLIANQITEEERRRAALLSSMGQKTYRIIIEKPGHSCEAGGQVVWPAGRGPAEAFQACSVGDRAKCGTGEER